MSFERSNHSKCTDTYEKINGADLYGMLHFFNFYLVRENPKTPTSLVRILGFLLSSNIYFKIGCIIDLGRPCLLDHM